MRRESTTWDKDSLEDGYVLARPADGTWWHLHFARTGWEYQSELLGRRTEILACVQRFAAGGVAQSPQFLLTLDGEGVEFSAEETGLDFQWGQQPAVPELLTEALHFQREVLPLLHISKAFQRATERLMTADAIEVDGDMVTVRSGSGGEDMIFGTAEDDFLEEDE